MSVRCASLEWIVACVTVYDYTGSKHNIRMVCRHRMVLDDARWTDLCNVTMAMKRLEKLHLELMSMSQMCFPMTPLDIYSSLSIG